MNLQRRAVGVVNADAAQQHSNGSPTVRSIASAPAEAKDAGIWSAYPPILSMNADIPPLQLCAKTGREQSQHDEAYSMTSSARASRVGGISMPSALAVGRLMTSSNLIDCMTGRSFGLAPVRIRPV